MNYGMIYINYHMNLHDMLHISLCLDFQIF